MTYLAPLWHDMDRHGIAADLMMFSGFPGETASHRLETARFLLDNRRYLYEPVKFGRFELLDGAAVQKAPARFGAKLHVITENDRLVRPDLNEWTLTKTPVVQPDVELELRAALTQLCAGVHVDGRPWAGASGSAHTFLYFAARGLKSIIDYNRFVHSTRSFLVSQIAFAPVPDATTFAGRAGKPA